MNASMVAVMAGNYSFVVVNINEIKVSVKKTNTKVKIDNRIYYIYKAKSFEGSQMIDKLMDKHIEYSLDDYKIG